jgi:seryl-tRNA synthetase
MLDVKFIRDNTSLVKERLAIKNFKELNIVDEIIDFDGQRKKLQSESDTTQSKINAASKEIGLLMAKKENARAEEKKQEVALLKSSLQPIAAELDKIEKQLIETLLRLPNLPSEKVPAGKTPEDNIVVREGGGKPQLPPNALPHWDLAKKYNLIDFELGNKITGSGFRLYQ